LRFQRVAYEFDAGGFHQHFDAIDRQEDRFGSQSPHAQAPPQGIGHSHLDRGDLDRHGHGGDDDACCCDTGRYAVLAARARQHSLTDHHPLGHDCSPDDHPAHHAHANDSHDHDPLHVQRIRRILGSTAWPPRTTVVKGVTL
jgi:hypothetical protein